MTITRHQYNPQIVLISKKFWDSLNDEEKAVFQSSATEARDYQRKVSRELDGKAIEEIKKPAWKSPNSARKKRRNCATP